MSSKIELFNKKQLRKEGLDIRVGDNIRIHQAIQEKGKERTQVFEGVVIAKKHGKGASSTITVRRVVSGVGVENILPFHSPSLKKIEVLKRAKTRRAKLYYLKTAKGKKTRLKRKDLAEAIVFEEEKPKEKSQKPEETSEEESSEPQAAEPSKEESAEKPEETKNEPSQEKKQ